jgi:hypothetical protein
MKSQQYLSQRSQHTPELAHAVAHSLNSIVA